jgi:hypothetical protein
MKNILSNQLVPSAQNVPKEIARVYRYNERKTKEKTKLRSYTKPK